MGRVVARTAAAYDRTFYAVRTQTQPAAIRIRRERRKFCPKRRLGSIITWSNVRNGILSVKRRPLLRNAHTYGGNRKRRLAFTGDICCRHSSACAGCGMDYRFQCGKVGEFYGKLRTIQKWLNIIVGGIFIAAGIYYCIMMYL